MLEQASRNPGEVICLEKGEKISLARIAGIGAAGLASRRKELADGEEIEIKGMYHGYALVVHEFSRGGAAIGTIIGEVALNQGINDLRVGDTVFYCPPFGILGVQKVRTEYFTDEISRRITEQ